MNDAIKDMASWNEAANWLARHGYGLEQIRMEKELWDEAKAATVTKPAIAPTTKVVTTATKKA